MKQKNLLRKTACAAAAAGLTLQMCACSPSAVASDGTVDLMRNVTAHTGAPASERFQRDEVTQARFEAAYNDFAVTLLRQSMGRRDDDGNVMVSPLSVMTALTMTANGAQGETLAQMTRVMGGSLELEALDGYVSDYVSQLPCDAEAKLLCGNSIWLRKDKTDVKKTFLQTNADYFHADIFSAPFDDGTRTDINQWVSRRTDGMVNRMLDEIPKEAVMYLVNALVFDAEWEKIYSEDQIFEAPFTGEDGETVTAAMMSSEETGWLDDGRATGFVKPYASGYRFAALLPEEGLSVEDYISGMDCSVITEQIRRGGEEQVNVMMPKFRAEYAAELSDTLKAMGMPLAFDRDKADFSGIADVRRENLYIGRVLHKTAVSVDERGTRAGAGTAVEIQTKSMLMGHFVYLNRPFVYMIVDDATCLPIFIGAVTRVE